VIKERSIRLEENDLRLQVKPFKIFSRISNLPNGFIRIMSQTNERLYDRFDLKVENIKSKQEYLHRGIYIRRLVANDELRINDEK